MGGSRGVGRGRRSLIATFACIFSCCCLGLICGRGTGRLAMSPPGFGIFPMFPNFLGMVSAFFSCVGGGGGPVGMNAVSMISFKLFGDW